MLWLLLKTLNIVLKFPGLYSHSEEIKNIYWYLGFLFLYVKDLVDW